MTSCFFNIFSDVTCLVVCFNVQVKYRSWSHVLHESWACVSENCSRSFRFACSTPTDRTPTSLDCLESSVRPQMEPIGHRLSVHVCRTQFECCFILCCFQRARQEVTRANRWAIRWRHSSSVWISLETYRKTWIVCARCWVTSTRKSWVTRSTAPNSDGWPDQQYCTQPWRVTTSPPLAKKNYSQVASHVSTFHLSSL